MITKEEFLSFIKNYQTFVNSMESIQKSVFGSLYECNFSDCEWYDSVNEMFDIFLDTHFTREGCNLICWQLFDNVDHIIYQTVEADLFKGKSEIEYDVNDLEDLWNYMVKFKDEYFLYV